MVAGADEVVRVLDDAGIPIVRLYSLQGDLLSAYPPRNITRRAFTGRGWKMRSAGSNGGEGSRSALMVNACAERVSGGSLAARTSRASTGFQPFTPLRS